MYITDISELGKHSDSMQKSLFGESKAKELNFVGDLAEKVSKAFQPQIKKNSRQAERVLVEARVHQALMGRMIIPLTEPARLLEIKAVKVFTRKSLTITTGLFRGPPPKESLAFLGGGGGRPKAHSRREVQQAVLASSQQELRTRKTEVSLPSTST